MPEMRQILISMESYDPWFAQRSNGRKRRMNTFDMHVGRFMLDYLIANGSAIASPGYSGQRFLPSSLPALPACATCYYEASCSSRPDLRRISRLSQTLVFSTTMGDESQSWVGGRPAVLSWYRTDDSNGGRTRVRLLEDVVVIIVVVVVVAADSRWVGGWSVPNRSTLTTVARPLLPFHPAEALPVRADCWRSMASLSCFSQPFCRLRISRGVFFDPPVRDFVS
ncbi:hypothetical protein LZ31DRAFT_146544 [Colletotrichum somersetense]|nr:hypothetical protein LZ31DRAFT_146544 [Colletotrichum somersetense]